MVAVCFVRMIRGILAPRAGERAGQIDCGPADGHAQAARDLLADQLGIELRFVARVAELPWLHRDPFDRLIIAQALMDNWAVVTNDPHFAAYGVALVWSETH
jgi:PIN domain nuclease of toxin-antitoxin system